MKLVPLIFLITVALGITVVSAQTTYEQGTVFLSDVGGGNITFAENITATLFSNAVGNQARFTVVHMLANGTWSRLGFRNDNGNNSMNVTNLGTNYIAFDAIIENNTILEVYLPDHGEPDTVTGGIADNWIAPTLFITMTGDDTVILEYGADEPTYNMDGLDNGFQMFITLLPLVVLAFVLELARGGGYGIVNNRVIVYSIVAAVVAIILAVIRIAGGFI